MANWLGDWIGGWISKHVPKSLLDIGEQAYLLYTLNDMSVKAREEYLARTFPFRCPNCSSEMRIDKEDPEYDFCGSCGKRYMELFSARKKFIK